MKNEIATSNNKLNTLRASVLGANDGIVSTAGLVLGVVGATIDKEAVLLAGVAGLISGALSMAAGEYVSVSSQRDSKKAYQERRKEADKPSKKLAEGVQLVKYYLSIGMEKETALQAAKEVTVSGNAIKALNLGELEDDQDLVNPWHSAISAAISFTAGSLIPILAIAFSPVEIAPISTLIAVVISLILAGALSATAAKTSRRKSSIRIVIWGVGVMVLTYGVGSLIGVGLS